MSSKKASNFKESGYCLGLFAYIQTIDPLMGKRQTMRSTEDKKAQ